MRHRFTMPGDGTAKPAAAAPAKTAAPTESAPAAR
jgi:hypothetical protein